MIVTSDLIDHLYSVPKQCHAVLNWSSSRGRPYRHFGFQKEIICDDGHLLHFVGYYQHKRHIARWGFTLTFMRRYLVRSWDLAECHYSIAEGRKIKGRGRHKHYWLGHDTARDVYEIPEGEISILDPNTSTLDFCEECNIRLVGGYQSHIF